MMTINRRRTYGGGYAANPYIMDGCIGMWDAEWNNGLNIHNPSATIWKDLSSVGKDLSMRQGEGYFTWENNCIRCLGKGYVASLNERYDQFLTIECVFSVDDIGNDGTLRMQHIVCANSSEGFVKGVMANAYSGNWVGVQMGEHVGIYISNTYNGFNGKKVSVTGIFTSADSFSLSKVYYNGIQKTICNLPNGARSDFFTIGGQSNELRLLKGRIYTIRLYNRALSDEEVEQNWLIDKERFEITTII